MKITETYRNCSFSEWIDSIAREHLTDTEYELEFQGLHLHDQCRYLMYEKGVNVGPNAKENGISL